MAMNLEHPLVKQCYDLIQAIEICGASPELTHAVTKAGELMRAVSDKFNEPTKEKKSATLKQLLDALHEGPGTSSGKELKDACELIIRVQKMSGGEIDVIQAAFRNGPLFDGDVPSKSARDTLLLEGFIAKVVVKGQDGYNACTHKGAWAHRLLRAGACD
jgi:hypothetical protein